jgi:hypothetical protein
MPLVRQTFPRKRPVTITSADDRGPNNGLVTGAPAPVTIYPRLPSPGGVAMIARPSGYMLIPGLQPTLIGAAG